MFGLFIKGLSNFLWKERKMHDSKFLQSRPLSLRLFFSTLCALQCLHSPQTSNLGVEGVLVVARDNKRIPCASMHQWWDGKVCLPCSKEPCHIGYYRATCTSRSTQVSCALFSLVIHVRFSLACMRNCICSAHHNDKSFHNRMRSASHVQHLL